MNGFRQSQPSLLATVLSPRPPQSGAWANIARGLAFFWGGLALIGTITNLRSSFDPNIFWVDLRWLLTPLRSALTIAFALSLLAFAIKPDAGVLRRRITTGLLGFFLTAIAWNAAQVIVLNITNRVTNGIFLPASILILLSLLPVLWVQLRPKTDSRTRPVWVLSALIAAGICFPVIQAYCFGKTDYERPSEVAVVFGARVLRDGRMTTALRDRVARACELYADGQVKFLLFSGGPGDGPITEAEAMQKYARQHGVPDNAIIVDNQGLDTEATVTNSLDLLREAGIHGRIIAVSEFYHLPRIKLTYQAHGRNVFTVPAHASRMARNFPVRSVLREIPAMWFYYSRSVLRACLG